MTRDPNAPKIGLEWYTKGGIAAGALAGARDAAATGTPLPTTGPTAAMMADDLATTMRITDGPYFVGELIEADLTLANRGTLTYEILGATKDFDCGYVAISLSVTGGGAPHFQMPRLNFPVNCPPPDDNNLAPGQTWRITTFLPLTASGELTLTASSRFMGIFTSPTAQPTSIAEAGPFAGHWPLARIQVASRMPADHAIQVHLNGSYGTISAPSAALAHLRYYFGATCYDAAGVLSTGMDSVVWDPLPAPFVSMPSCDGSSEVWSFAVGAPGYGIGTRHYATAS